MISGGIVVGNVSGIQVTVTELGTVTGDVVKYHSLLGVHV